VVNGGRHAKNPLEWQEFMVIPVGATSFHEAYLMGLRVFEQLWWLLVERESTITTPSGKRTYAPMVEGLPRVTPAGVDDYATIDAILANLQQAIDPALLGDE